MNPDDLIGIARELVRRDTGRPKQASLKRAVSTAYYAVFHALAHECIVQTIGWRFSSDRYWETITPLYRALDHGAAKALCNRLLGDRDRPADLKEFARTFVELQAERIRADYDPKPSFTRTNANVSLANAETAISLFRAFSPEIRREISVQLITRQR